LDTNADAFLHCGRDVLANIIGSYGELTVPPVD
jgi:hypothetical protein